MPLSTCQDKAEKQSFFNYFYLAINIGSLIACTCIVWVQVCTSTGVVSCAACDESVKAVGGVRAGLPGRRLERRLDASSPSLSRQPGGRPGRPADPMVACPSPSPSHFKIRIPGLDLLDTGFLDPSDGDGQRRAAVPGGQPPLPPRGADRVANGSRGEGRDRRPALAAARQAGEGPRPRQPCARGCAARRGVQGRVRQAAGGREVPACPVLLQGTGLARSSSPSRCLFAQPRTRVRVLYFEFRTCCIV
jgi:hypothetical protein